MSEWIRNDGSRPDHVTAGKPFEARYKDGCLISSRCLGALAQNDALWLIETDPDLSEMIDIYEWRPL